MDSFYRPRDLNTGAFIPGYSIPSPLCIQSPNRSAAMNVQSDFGAFTLFSTTNNNSNNMNFRVPPPSPQQIELVVMTNKQQQQQQRYHQEDKNIIGDQLNAADIDAAANDCSMTSSSLANQKTPMSAIVELARYNKLTHKYELVNESGPAHNKEFTVKLILLEGEEYIGVGPSIKKAQQAAAKLAMENTALPKPSFLTKKRIQTVSVVSPTVTLNALLLKLKLSAEYADMPSYRCPVFNVPQTPLNSNMPSFGNTYSQGSNNFQCNTQQQNFTIVHCIFLKIGRLEFAGRGATRQLARQNAAEQAVEVLQNIYYCSTTNNQSDRTSNHEFTAIRNANNTTRFLTSKSVDNNVDPVLGAKIDDCSNNIDSEQDLIDSGEKLSSAKSPISVIYEIALRKKLAINFGVISESGPAHERSFVIRLTLNNTTITSTPMTPPARTEKSRDPGGNDVIVYPLTVDGEGRNKKRAKYDSCLKMLERIKLDDELCAEFIQILNQSAEHTKEKVARIKRETIIKDAKVDPNYGQQINPVSRLVQIQQARKQDEPKFALVGESGQGRYKEYTIEVTIGDQSCNAVGPNKKLAKRTAAELMLEKLGFNKPLPKPGKPVLKQKSSIPTQNGDDQQQVQNNDNRSSPVNENDACIANTIITGTANNSSIANDESVVPRDETNLLADISASASSNSAAGNISKRRVTFDVVNNSDGNDQSESRNMTPIRDHVTSVKSENDNDGWPVAPNNSLLYDPSIVKNEDEISLNESVESTTDHVIESKTTNFRRMKKSKKPHSKKGPHQFSNQIRSNMNTNTDSPYKPSYETGKM